MQTSGWSALSRLSGRTSHWPVSNASALSAPRPTPLVTGRVANPANACRRIAYSPDGKSLAVLSGRHGAQSTINLWDTSTGKELRKMEEASDCQGGLAFSPDGKTLTWYAWSASKPDPKGVTNMMVWDRVN